MNGSELSGGAIAGIAILAVVFYVYVAFCLWKIAQKFDLEYAWLAWIPIANLWVMCKLAGYGGAWFLLFIVPCVGFIFGIYVWYKITQNLGKPDLAVLFGILMAIPIAQFIVIGIMAFSEDYQPQVPLA